MCDANVPVNRNLTAVHSDAKADLAGTNSKKSKCILKPESLIFDSYKCPLTSNLDVLRVHKVLSRIFLT